MNMLFWAPARCRPLFDQMMLVTTPLDSTELMPSTLEAAHCRRGYDLVAFAKAGAEKVVGVEISQSAVRHPAFPALLCHRSVAPQPIPTLLPADCNRCQLRSHTQLQPLRLAVVHALVYLVHRHRSSQPDRHRSGQQAAMPAAQPDTPQAHPPVHPQLHILHGAVTRRDQFPGVTGPRQHLPSPWAPTVLCIPSTIVNSLQMSSCNHPPNNRVTLVASLTCNTAAPLSPQAATAATTCPSLLCRNPLCGTCETYRVQEHCTVAFDGSPMLTRSERSSSSPAQREQKALTCVQHGPARSVECGVDARR